jgi:2-dehydropantoate 2-reductase
MQDDFRHGRATEIEFLQGEIVAVADQYGRAAPINAKLVELVRSAEAGGKRDFTGAELWAQLRPTSAG